MKMDKKFDKELFQSEVKGAVRNMFRKELDEASSQQIFQAVSMVVKEWIIDDWIDCHKAIKEQDAKVVYYLSMEFLEGRALGNNLINLCRDKDVREALSELGLDLNQLEDEEHDPALGNGGLGRLAACFLDSLSTLGYPAYGCGIRYKYGLFQQKIENGFQVEKPDNWLKNGYPFEIKRSEYACEIKFGGYVETQWDGHRNHFVHKGYQAVKAVPYDIPIVGYNNGMVNTLRVWDAEPIEAFKLEEFDKGNYQRAVEQASLAKTIVDVLYPNDNHMSGKELRLRQQYFFVSASLQRAVQKYMETHDDIHGLPEKVVFHMNDTHPTLTVPELMRILLDDYKLEWDEAWEITTHCCAFTNHTIMSEALEKWPLELFSRLLPRVYQIVEEMNRRFVNLINERCGGDARKHETMDIIYNGKVRMANMAIVGSYSVNGVAAIHTEILKNEVFKDYYELWPEKFSNKTNGITQRRFLLHANPQLAEWITDKIGPEWITDLSQIKKIEVYADDKKAQQEIESIKYHNKVRLAKYIKEHNGIDVDPRSVFDVQIKRLHEYKRQLMNILHVMYVYNQLKENPNMDMVPRTYIFGAKAAPGYYRAKMTIKLINAVADVINNDKTIGGKMKVVFIEDYKVSNAELIIPAADVSEQISTASKEASGTSNMKFMLNGALTLGTMDGANIEIVEEAGRENAFIFGLSASEVIELEKHRNNGSYNPMDIFNSDPEIRKMLMQLINGYYSPDDPERFRDIYNSLLNKQSAGGIADQYFILKDFRSYCEAHEEVDRKFRDDAWWAKAAIINIANAGKFSSDRTIEEYVKDIWHLKKLKLQKEGK